jgi:imidazolonepropionase-like amidohydrolase
MMLPRMIFTNAGLIFPDRISEGLSIRVSDGKITQVGAEIDVRGDEVIDLKGN